MTTTAARPLSIRDTPLKTGERVFPTIGAAGLWDHVYAAPPLRTNTANGGAVSGVQDCMGASPLTGFGTVFRDGDRPALEIAVTSAGTGSQTTSIPAPAEWTALVILEANAYTNSTVQFPNVAANFVGTWTVFSTANVTTTAPAAMNTRAVHVFRRSGNTLSIWTNGAKTWEGTLSWNSLTTGPMGFKPARAGVDSVVKGYEYRLAKKALTDAQIVAASADARALHGI